MDVLLPGGPKQENNMLMVLSSPSTASGVKAPTVTPLPGHVNAL